MTKDRLKDLQKTNSWSRVSYSRLSRQRRHHDGHSMVTDGIAQFATIQMHNENPLTEFLAQIDLLRILIDKIEELAKAVDIIHKKMLEPIANPKLADELDEQTADIRKLAYDVSTKLKKMEQIQKDHNDRDKTTAEWRIREVQLYNMFNRFREVMNKYNQESVSHRERCKTAIKRELDIAGSRKTDAELEDMIENGFPGTFQNSIMVDVERARQAANQIEARHRDISKLENSISELHNMFQDLALLVTAQGTMIDNIEHNVSQAANYVEEVGHILHETVIIDRNNRRKKFLILFIMIIIVVVVFVIIGAYYGIQKKIVGK